MQHWNLDELFCTCTLPPDLKQILERVHAASCFQAQTTVRVVRLGRAGGLEGDLDTGVYEVIMELAPGVEVVITDGPIGASSIGAADPDAADEAQDRLLAAVERTLTTAMPQIDALCDAVHDAQLMARRMLASMAGGSAKASLSAVRLTSPDRWSTTGEPEFLVLLDAIGPGLATQATEIRIPNVDKLHEALSKETAYLDRRYAQRRDLMALGATGTIDQIALNAIDHFGSLEETLRRFRSEWRFWLPDGTALMIDDGCVSSANGVPGMPVDWAGEWLIVAHDRLKLDLGSAIGRPATDVVDHPFLSPDIVVTEADLVHDDGRGAAILTLQMPRKLFCSASGRVWDGNPTPDLAKPRSAREANVLASRRRRP